MQIADNNRNNCAYAISNSMMRMRIRKLKMNNQIPILRHHIPKNTDVRFLEPNATLISVIKKASSLE
jgi:hypothetical protein